jgi:hypothetical protein
MKYLEQVRMGSGSCYAGDTINKRCKDECRSDLRVLMSAKNHNPVILIGGSSNARNLVHVSLSTEGMKEGLTIEFCFQR